MKARNPPRTAIANRYTQFLLTVPTSVVSACAYAMPCMTSGPMPSAAATRPLLTLGAALRAPPVVRLTEPLLADPPQSVGVPLEARLLRLEERPHRIGGLHAIVLPLQPLERPS